MKKIIICIFMFISVIGYMLSYENVRNIYDISIALSPEQSNGVASFLLFSNEYTKTNDNEITKYLLDLCEKNQVSIVKTSPIDEYHVKKYVFMAENLYKNVGLNLSVEQINHFNENKNSLITNDMSKKSDLYFPYFPIDQKYYIYNYKNYDYVDGSYTLIGENAKKVLSDFKKAFSGISIDGENFDVIAIDKNIMNSPRIRSFIQLTIILLVIAIVCILMCFSQVKEKLSIKKMFGHSSIRLLVKENWKLFLEIIVLCVLIFTICIFLTVQEFNVFIILLIKYLFVFIFIELLMLFVILLFLYYFFKKVHFVQILKHKKDFKTLLTLNIILRIVIVVLGLSIISDYFKPMLIDFNNVMSYSKFIEKSEGYFKADNMVRLEDDVPGYLELLYDQVNKSGGIGVEKSVFREWNSEEESIFYNVNENYVNFIQLKDIHGEKIKVNKNGVQIFTSKKNKELARKLLEVYSNSGNIVKLIDIASNQRVFTFDNDVNEGGVGYVEDPIIVITDFINPWFVYMKENQIEKDAYDKALRDGGYKATFDMYAVNDKTKALYDAWVRALSQEIILLTISFLALCAVIAQYVIAYIDSFKKSIAIKKSMGYSMIKRYDNMIMIMSFFYFVVWSYCFIWGRPLIEQVTVLIMFVFECILSIFLIIKNERKITAESLKE